MKRIKILIVAENKILCDSISALLNKQADINVVATICNEIKRLELITRFKTDIVLLDLGVPNQDNLNLVKMIKANSPSPKIILMDFIASQADIFEYIQAGVSGFLTEDTDNKKLLKAIRSAYKGFKILPQYLTGTLFTQIIKHETDEANISVFNKFARLTKREKQVMGLISDGFTNKEIAQTLEISTSTAKSHVHNILEKLSLSTRVQIAKHAFTLDAQNQK
jgi:DNA-binding NarL/FixJ family response regulator